MFFRNGVFSTAFEGTIQGDGYNLAIMVEWAHELGFKAQLHYSAPE